MNYKLIASKLQHDLCNRLSSQPLGVPRPILPQLPGICSAAAMLARSERSLEAPSPVLVDKMLHDLQQVPRHSYLLLCMAGFYSSRRNGQDTARRLAAAILPEQLTSPEQQLFVLSLIENQLSVEKTMAYIRQIYRLSPLHRDLHAHFGEKRNLHTQAPRDWLKLLEEDAAAGRQTVKYAIKHAIALAVHRRFPEASQKLASTLRDKPGDLSLLTELLMEELVQSAGPRWDLDMARACLEPLQPFLNSPAPTPISGCAWKIQIALNHHATAWELIRQMNPTQAETLAIVLNSVVQFWIYEQPDWAQQAMQWMESGPFKGPECTLLLPKALAHACTGRREAAAGYLDGYLEINSRTLLETNCIENRRLYWIAIVQALVRRTQDALQSFESWHVERPAKDRFEPLFLRAMKEGSS